MNILFTCAGRRTYLLKYFKENLLEGDKIVATDMQLSAPALQVADVKIQVPAVYDPEYVNITLRICEEQKIDALFSLNDLELPILAENKARFEAIGVKVVVSDPKVIDIAFDKYKTARGVESLGWLEIKGRSNLLLALASDQRSMEGSEKPWLVGDKRALSSPSCSGKLSKIDGGE